MKNKFKFDIKGFINKKENVAIIAIAVIFCAGIVVTNIKSDNIPLHDGDILVDSQKVTENSEKAEEAKEEKSGETFEEKRASIDLERNKIMTKITDEKEKKRITGYMEKEVEIEGIIKQKNLPESFVIITDSSVNVTVDQQDLKQDTVAKICNIVMQETKRSADKIVIQSAY